MTETTPRKRRWQVSLTTLVLVVATAAVVFDLLSPERPPPPLTPKTELERRILELANAHVRTQAPNFNVPIEIAPGGKDGTFVVTYWTPHRELQLLGPRAVFVTPESEKVEIVMRD